MAPTQSTIIVLLNLGHRAKHRTVEHEKGFTHDWSAYVQGAKGTDIKHFVEKVVFRLHETFDNPVQECTEPPYMISESGYASFTLNIDVYFKNDEQPNMVTYSYDLYLPGEGQPPVQYFRQEKLSFKNTPDNFRQRLLRGGAEEQEEAAKLEDQKEKERKLAAAGKSGKVEKKKTVDDEKLKKKKDKKRKEKSKHKEKKEKSDKHLTSDKPTGVLPFGTVKLKDDSLASERKPSLAVKPQQIIDESSSGSSSDSQSDPPTTRVNPALNTVASQKSAKPPANTQLSDNSSDDSDSDDTFKKAAAAVAVPKRPVTIADTSKSKKPKVAAKGKKIDKKYNGGRTAPNGLALDMLFDLHEKIRASSDPSVMQKVVDTIEDHSSGQFKISDNSFDFDLCQLDSKVVRLLEGMF